MRRKQLFAITITILLISSLSIIEASAAQFGPITVKVADDTHVDSSNPDSPLGAEQYLDIESWGDASTSYHQIIWLKFSLSDAPTGAEFTQATLKVYAWFISGTPDVTAHYCSDNSWTESTLTYSNMPSYDTTPIDTTTVSEDEEWYSWDVLDAVRQASANNRQTVTIVLSEPMLSHDNSVYMYSKETHSLVMDVSPTLTLKWSSSTSATPKPTATPTPTTTTPTPTFTTPTPTSTPTTNGEQPNWAIWAVVLLVIVAVAVLLAYSLIKKKGKQPPLPPPPPPPPP